MRRVSTQHLDLSGGARLLRPDAPAEPTAVLPTDPAPGVVDALALAAAYADELLVGTARDTHRAFADRVFESASRVGAGPVVAAPRVLHDGVAATVYGSITLALRAAGEGLSRLSRAGVRGPALDDSAPGRALQSAVNGLIGEKLDQDHPHLSLPLTVRVGGRGVPVERPSLRRAFPHATGRVLVFVHGLGEHEGIWDLRREEAGGSYGSRLEMAAGWTPVYLRANTGLPVTHNGVSLTALLQDLVDQWPVEVTRVALVGHSMGGLIIRAACSVTTDHERPWVQRLSDVVTLGTPHLGADLARAVKHGSRFLGLTPSRPASAGSSTTAPPASATSSAGSRSSRHCRTCATASSPPPSALRAARWAGSSGTCSCVAARPPAARRRSAAVCCACSPTPTCSTSPTPTTGGC